jgi:hypothetical protein
MATESISTNGSGCGLPEQQIKDEILHARDLSKKGGAARQLDYAQRTAIKAFSTVDLLR